MRTDAPRLEARGLSLAIGEVEIVRQLDLAVSGGEVLGLIGPNGAGKTTAIDLMSGFLLPDSGSVRVDGMEVTRLAPDRRARLGLARTFQESPTISDLSVSEHLQLSLEAAGRHRAGPGPSTEELLDRVGLGDVWDLPGASLPIARRRMLDLARALGTRPGILLLDEPFAGLEKRDEERLMEAVERLRERGAAVVVVEHRLKLLNDIVDSVAVLVQGALLAAGRLDDVLRDPAVQRAYLGTGRPGEEAT